MVVKDVVNGKEVELLVESLDGRLDILLKIDGKEAYENGFFMPEGEVTGIEDVYTEADGHLYFYIVVDTTEGERVVRLDLSEEMILEVELCENDCPLPSELLDSEDLSRSVA